MSDALWYAGRLLLGGYFLQGAYNHFTKVGMMAGYSQSKGVPLPKPAVIVTGVLLLVGGLSVLFNLYTEIGLIALALFLIPVTLWMHAYWKVQDAGARVGERVNFYKNLALLGAVLILLSR